VDPVCLEDTDPNDLVSPNRRGRTEARRDHGGPQVEDVAFKTGLKVVPCS